MRGKRKGKKETVARSKKGEGKRGNVRKGMWTKEGKRKFKGFLEEKEKKEKRWKRDRKD